MRPHSCTVCGNDAWEAHKASWGPITVYYHPECEVYYRDALAPRLRDSLVRTIRRWVLQDQPTIAKPREDTHEPTDP